MSIIEVPFPSEENAGKILQWRVSKGTMISAGRVLLSYQNVNNNPDEKKTEKKLRATEFGRVTELLVRQGDIVQPGKMILSMTGCDHPTVMIDLCAQCGADLRKEVLKNNVKTKNVTEASVPMLHSIPELKVSPKLAKKIGKEDEQRLLQDKKLALLVDLDQTIIHTTMENVPVNIKDVHHFQLCGTDSQWHHMRLRPGTQHFLSEMSKLYELHICTFGTRSYAHKVAELLDEKGTLFSHRILSRDECFNPELKAANLHALFPCGDDLVCIIDDREDVWQGCANLVQVKPYNFFKHTGDIHAPPGLDRKNLPPTPDPAETKNSECKKDKIVEESEENKQGNESNQLEETKIQADNDKQNDTLQVETEVKVDDNSKEIPDTEMLVSEDKTDETQMKKEEELKENDKEKKLESNDLNKKENNLEKKDVVPEDDDHDDYLLYLEDILRRIHSEFYKYIEESNRKPLKKIIPDVRAGVLKGLHLTFSGLVPTNQKLYHSRPYKVARAFGARVSEDINDNTTHLVAIQPGTAKVNSAKKNDKIKIVNSGWLWSCAERWELVDERLYPLTIKARGSRIPPPHCSSPGRVDEGVANDTFASSINPLMSFSKQEIDDMGNEVEEDSSDSDIENFIIPPGDPIDQVDFNDTDSSDDDEGAPKKRRKVFDKNSSNDSDDDKNDVYGSFDHDDDELKDEEDEDPIVRFRRGGELPDDLDLGDNSQNSVEEDDDGEWNEMGAALEREFLSD